jgi:hypothetical protein
MVFDSLYEFHSLAFVASSCSDNIPWLLRPRLLYSFGSSLAMLIYIYLIYNSYPNNYILVFPNYVYGMKPTFRKSYGGKDNLRPLGVVRNDNDMFKDACDAALRDRLRVQNGKGDSPRNCFSPEFRQNFDLINFHRENETSNIVIDMKPNG